ncbi:hypothetical protein EV175_000196 [Coemansia sp. RSA 1933]|nr:hypothetical protein EV175_000196 [Coemansia sp. RSA 1933]
MEDGNGRLNGLQSRRKPHETSASATTADSIRRRNDRDDFQEPIRLPAPRRLTGRTKAFEKNVPNRLDLRSSADTTDPSRPRSISGHSREIPTISPTQSAYTNASKDAKARTSRAIALTLDRGSSKRAEHVTQIDSDNSSDGETHTVARGTVNLSQIPDEVTLVSRRRELASARSGVGVLFGMAATKARVGSSSSSRKQADDVDASVDIASSSGKLQHKTTSALATALPHQTRPPTASRAADNSESIRKKVSGFGTMYLPDHQRLATLDSRKPGTVGSPPPLNGRRCERSGPWHPVTSPPPSAKPAAVVRTKIVDRLQPKSHKDEDNDPADTAAGSPKKPVANSSIRSRARIADEYLMSTARSPQRAAAARRKTSVIPKTPNPKYPQKVVPLVGVQIGKYTKLSDSHHSHHHGAPNSLKLSISFLQRCLMIHGIKDGDEHMRVDHADIASIEARIQDGLVVLRIAPMGTMENLFDPMVFDPASENRNLCLIILCWQFQAKSDDVVMRRLGEVFSDTGHFPVLDKSDFDKYSAELNKPLSIDLISSSDDDEAAAAEKMSEKVAGNASTSSTADPLKDAPYWASVDSSVAGGVSKKAWDKASGEAPDSSDDMWSPLSLANKRKTPHPTCGEWLEAGAGGYSGEMKRNRLRRRTTGGPGLARKLYTLEDSPESEGSGATQQQEEARAYFPSDYTLRFEYPRGGPKAISVTGADISRLYMGEFLNDTIIEFYLRYIGENLRKSDPEMYNQCFFFNSFFFKKLSHRARTSTTMVQPDGSTSPANPVELVYRQLKKWTASVELFGKRYIFVPINENIHWYLAIIVNPQEMIDDGTADGEQVEEDNDKSMVDIEGPDETTPKRRLAFAASAAAAAANDNANVQPQEAEEEEQRQAKTGLSRYFSTYSARKTSEDAGEISTDVGMAEDKDNEADRTEKPSEKPSAEGSSSQQSDPGDLPPAHDVVIDLSGMHSPKRQSTTSKEEEARQVIMLSPDHPRKAANAVKVRFMEREVEIPDSKYSDPQTTPAIIILDSLGNRHQQTFGLLRNYMQAEAQSRLGMGLKKEATVGRYAKVPLQHNLCDCGVFLLHYVEEIVKDPVGFVAMALGGVSMRDWFSSYYMQVKRREALELAGRLAEEHVRLGKGEQGDTADAENGKSSEIGKSSENDGNAPDDDLNSDTPDNEKPGDSPDQRSADPDDSKNEGDDGPSSA